MNTYKMTLEDSVDSMTFDLLEVPIVDKDVEGAVDNTTLDGNIFTDYLWLKKNYVQKWSIMCDDEYSRLRGFYTRQFDNASVPTYNLFYGENISQDQAVSGDYILVNNPTDRNAPITSFELLGDAEQDGTPTPDSPVPIQVVTGENTVKITGKNLFDYSSASDAANTTVTQYRVFAISGLEPNARYTISGQTVPQITDANKYIYFWSADTYSGAERKASLKSASTVTFDANANGEIYLAIYPTDTATWTSILSEHFTNAQLELGSTATTYEPYQAQTLPVNLGKNLLNVPSPLANTGVVTYSINLPAGTYTLSFSNATTTGQGTNYYFRIYDDNNTDLATRTLSNSVNKWTFTISSTATKIGVYSQNTWAGSSGVTTTFTGLMIELGSQATTYAPYFTPIELAKIGNYQDRIYETDGKWYLEKQVGKVVLNGSEDWGTQNDVFRMNFSDAKQSNEYMAEAFVISDHFKGETTRNRGEFANLCCGKVLGANQQVAFRYDALNNVVADFKTWLASNPTTVYYALATPYDEEITNSELVGQLEAILQAYLYAGTNNISNNAVGPNLAGQMNIGYKLIFSEETVLIEPTAVRLTLTDGGIINVCGCRQNVQLTMRETIQ